MTEVRKLWRDKASAGGSNPSLSIFSQPHRNHEPPQPYRRALLFVAAILTFTMKLLAAISIILAYGPAIFDLALTGRGVSRPTQTSTTDWTLTQFHTLHIGKPSLAIPPTGLAGAVLTRSGHNNQDSTVPIWTTVHATSRRALANLGSFVNNFHRRRLDRQWRYIRGWWRYNSGRVIEDALIVYFYSMPFLTVVLRIWRKRVLRQRRSESKRVRLTPSAISSLMTDNPITHWQTATLAQPSPILASSVAVKSLVRTDLIQTTQPDIHSSSTKNVISIVAIGGTSTPSPYHLTHHLPFDSQSSLLIPSSGALGASTTYPGIVSAYEELSSGSEDSKPRQIVVVTLIALLGGLVIIHYEAVDGIALWTVTIILSPRASSSSAVSRYADNIYRVIPKRTVTFPSHCLIEAGPPQSNIPVICSTTSRRLFGSSGLALPRALLPPKIVRRGAEPLPSHEVVIQPNVSLEQKPALISPSFISVQSVEGVLIMVCCSTGDILCWSIQFFAFQHYHISQHIDNDEALSTKPSFADTALLDVLLREKSLYAPWTSPFAGILTLDIPRQTVNGPLAIPEVGVEPETQMVLALPVATNDANEGDEADEEEGEGNDLVDAAFLPLPPSRPTSPNAEEINNQGEEEFLQATFIPLPESRPESPEFHALDSSTRSSYLYQYISALYHQYLIHRAVGFQPICPEEATALRAEWRPRLSSLRERALIRYGLGSPAPIEEELEGRQQQQEEKEEDEEVKDEEAQDEDEDDPEIDPSREDLGVVNVDNESRRPFRLEIPIGVIRHISTNIL
ncbi:hypothetical protein FRC04_000557 [Tulasnella sp. 424]|nr:hypothetical protein FRC04_000557 [Tulasnella sp. 424]KAG8961479.1 hypothetical protein FRC05_005935 [Tulasnella sp. 425]